MSNVSRVLEVLMYLPTIRRVTYYDSPKMVIKATRQRRYSKRGRQETYLVTIGRPNYAEKKFIKMCQRAYEPFPIKRLQYTTWPRARA